MENKEFGVGMAALIIGAVVGVIIAAPIFSSKVKETEVTKFFNGSTGYSLSIPTGNQSKCIWTWEGGNQSIPDIKGTTVNNATEKHTIEWFAGNQNLKVICSDDFGNIYKGKIIK